MQLTYSYFSGCKISGQLQEYGDSTRAIMHTLDVELVDLPFSCCGYPIRHQSMEAAVFASARNMAMAERAHLNILTPCKCCFGNLKHSQYLLDQDSLLAKHVNEQLKQEGLVYTGSIDIKHLLSVLFHDVGLENIQKHVIHPLKSTQKVAASYGCHALRPSNITNFDHPFNPTIFEKIIELTGAKTVLWPRRTECCGHPVAERNPELSNNLLQSKLSDATLSGADMICTACTYCQMQYDNCENVSIPILTISQLLKDATSLSSRTY